MGRDGARAVSGCHDSGILAARKFCAPSSRQDSMDMFETHLPSSPEAPQLARAFLRNALQTWQLDGFGEITELLTSELVTNVVVHVGSPITLRTFRNPDSLRIEVDDASTDPPVLEHPGTGDDHGRGILLVDSLADGWGTDIGADGKRVWFELHTATGNEEAHSPQ
jgi:anti-sigma regulatory factor (Ser/Thr protein kinase)